MYLALANGDCKLTTNLQLLWMHYKLNTIKQNPIDRVSQKRDDIMFFNTFKTRSMSIEVQYTTYYLLCFLIFFDFFDNLQFCKKKIGTNSNELCTNTSETYLVPTLLVNYTMGHVTLQHVQSVCNADCNVRHIKNFLNLNGAPFIFSVHYRGNSIIIRKVLR